MLPHACASATPTRKAGSEGAVGAERSGVGGGKSKRTGGGNQEEGAGVLLGRQPTRRLPVQGRRHRGGQRFVFVGENGADVEDYAIVDDAADDRGVGVA